MPEAPLDFIKSWCSPFTIQQQQIMTLKDPFSQLSNEWWDKNGKFQSLHKFTDIRIQYINRVVSKYKKPNKTYVLNKLKCLDIGCGGGLLSERIAPQKDLI